MSEPGALTSPVPARDDGPHLVVTLGVTCLGLFLVIASVTGLNGAAPDIALDTGASQEELTWIVDAYTLSLAGFLLPAGALGDLHGRRLLLQLGLLIFAIASAAPLVADSPGALITSRAIAGVGAACIMPATLSLITSTLPEAQRNLGVSIWALTCGAGGAAGLVLAGAILQVADWPWIFAAFAVLGLLVLAVSPFVAPSREPGQPPLDLPGAVMSLVFIGAGVLGVLEGPLRGWTDPGVLACFVLCAVSGALFVHLETSTRTPMLDVRLLGVPAFSAGTVALLMLSVTAFAVLFAAVQYLQFVHGLTALQAGAVLSLIGISLPPTALCAAPLTNRFGLRAVLLASGVILGLGVLSLSTADPQDGLAAIFLTVLLLGAGLGLGTPPATSAIVSSVPLNRQGVASAVNDVAREIGTALGVALAGSLIAAGYVSGIAAAASGLPPQQRALAESSIVGAQLVAAETGPAGTELRRVAKDAYADGLHRASTGVLVVIALSAGGLWVLTPGKGATQFPILSYREWLLRRRERTP